MALAAPGWWRWTASARPSSCTHPPACCCATSDGRADAIGVYVENSADVELRQLAVVQPLGPGIQFYRTRDSRAVRNFVARPAGDGIHVAGPSSGITLEHNQVFDSGDDGLSSIGYAGPGAPQRNQNIAIRHNQVRFRDVKWGSGVSVEGTTGAQVTDNTIERSGSAGIRIASIVGYSDLEGVRHPFVTDGVDDVEVADNQLVDVETRRDLDQGAIHIAAHTADVSNVRVHGNTISSASSAGTTVDAIRIIGSVTPGRIHYVRNTSVWGNRIVNASPGVLGAWCVGRSLATTVDLSLGQAPPPRTRTAEAAAADVAAPNTYSQRAAATQRSTAAAAAVRSCAASADR